MIPITPKLHSGASLVTFSKDQPKYLPLPASVDPEGTIMTEWELTANELQSILNGGRIRLTLLFTKVNLGEPLSPIKLEVLDAVECGFGI